MARPAKNAEKLPQKQRGASERGDWKRENFPEPVANMVDIEADYNGWLSQQANSLRQKAADLLDWSNLAEELDAMGASLRRQVKSRLIVLMAHLLKWEFCPNQRLMHMNSWRKTIREQRRELNDLIDESPSLGPYLLKVLPDAYPDARDDARDDTGSSDFPGDCPWSSEQILSRDFWPGAETSER
jgi:hypothetical protein